MNINTRITQLGVCSITIRQKDKNKLCRFYVVLRGGPALLGMPDTKIVDFISEKCSIIEPRRHSREINEQSAED